MSRRLDDLAGLGDVLVDVSDENHSRADAAGTHVIEMPGYGHRWLRVGAADNALDRAPN